MVRIEKIWLTDTAVWIRTTDGQEACEHFEEYPRLRYATQAQRENYQSDAFGIHWPDLDEDLSFDGFFRKRNDSPLYALFIAHPELNASAIARRLGWLKACSRNILAEPKSPPRNAKR